MKKYVPFVITCLLIVAFLVGIFYLLLKHDNLQVTYIKLQVNPSFVIGINDKRNVVFYNALNEDGNKYNLSMFEGKSLEEATKIFIEKLGYSKEDKDVINLTVMTKNSDLENELVSIMRNIILAYDSTYEVISHEPNNDDLEKYSNECIYNLTSTLNNNDLSEISNIVYNQVYDYVMNKLIDVPIDSLLNEDDIVDDYSLLNIDLSEYHVTLLENSSYSVIFNDGLMYDIKLYLEIEYKKEGEKKIIEVYTYNYQEDNNEGIITNLKKYYYSF